MTDDSIAVIGSGPSGLATAKHLLDEGLRPVLFEQSADLGGQWNTNSPHSGVWSSMPTNTSHITTRFSDFSHVDDLPMFPSNQQMHAYLRRYASHFKLDSRLRLNTRVDSIAPSGDRWNVTFSTQDQQCIDETFSHVIVASGRYNKPRIPAIKGIDLFKGTNGISHTFDYTGVEPFAGKRVLVVGNSVSGLEICADLAADARIRVISACRKPRYILSKILAGRPTDCVAFTRFASLAFRALPPLDAAEGLKQLVLRFCGNPEQYGGLKPSENILEANISQCQNYLPLIAEGKIVVKGAPVEFTEDAVEFDDGSNETVDAVIFATGFDLNLPFLSDDMRRHLDVDDTHLNLYQHTFHPDLPGLAFVGLYCQVGPYFPTVELQSRWVAMVFNNVRPLPSRESMLAGIAAHKEWRQHFHEVVFHDMALLFAQAAGVEPDLTKRSELAKALMYGPLSPTQFRMEGHGYLPEADQRFAQEAAQFGCVTTPELDAEQLQGLEMLAAKLKDEKWLAELVEKLP